MNPTTKSTQSTNQVPTPGQDLRARLERSLEVNGKPADKATIDRIVSSSNRPQSTENVRGCYNPKPFSLLR